MALIKCKECGHEISDKASVCPNCGFPMKGVGDAQEAIKENPKKKNGWIWVLMVPLLCLIGGGGYYVYNQTLKDNAPKEASQDSNISLIADGDYCYQGKWESSRYSSQSCKVEFTKKDSSLVNCSYTNLKYNSRIPLKGTIHGNELHFVGEIVGEKLVIDLKVSSDGNSLIGEGVDYAHSDKAQLNLTKGMVDNTTFSEEGRTKVRAEREKQEAEERASREEAERESKTWTGASSVSELRSKLIGTSWETTYDVLRYKITFSNDEVKICFTDLDGRYGYKSEENYKYELRDKDGHLFVLIGNSIPIDYTSDLEYSIVFKGNNASLYSNQAVRIGKLTFLGR